MSARIVWWPGVISSDITSQPRSRNARPIEPVPENNSSSLIYIQIETLGDVEIGLIAGYLASYRRNKRRLLRLRDIHRVDSQAHDELLDIENYIWEMPRDARMLGKAVLAVSKNRVWMMISAYLHEARLKPRPSFRVVHRTIAKLEAKMRKNILTQYEVKAAMIRDAGHARNWLRWA